jgi:hypothetical protein
VFSALFALVFALDLFDLQKPLLILYGVAAILTGLSLVRKDAPLRNFGIVTLAVFLFLDGINTVLLAFNSDYPLYLMSLTGIISLSAGIYFLFQRQIFKKIGLLMLSGYLICSSLSYFFITDAPIYGTFSMVSAILAIPAAISFFLRK